MAGLLSAAVIGATGRPVTVLEQDPAGGSGAAEPRGGVPQGRQPHVLLHSGLRTIEELLPGLRGQLTAAGGVPLDTHEGSWPNVR